MKRRLQTTGPLACIPLMFFLSLFCLLATNGNAQTSVPVELTGTFVSGEAAGPGAYTLEYEGFKRTFEVQDVRLLAPAYPSSASGWDILNEMGRQRILLTGRDALIRPIMQGKAPTGRYALDGTLYVSNGRLALESVRGIGKEKKK